MDSFAQAYHWSYEECLARTMPQILMLSHASDISRRRLDARSTIRTKNGTRTVEDQVNAMPMWNGKRVDQLTSEEYMQYHQIAG